MRPGRLLLHASLAVGLIAAAGCRQEGGQNKPAPPVATARGAELFLERCAPCHPGGGNTLNPKKTLHAGVLADHGIRDASGIVKAMRRPGPGMPAFDADLIPDADAILIAEYVLATYR